MLQWHKAILLALLCVMVISCSKKSTLQAVTATNTEQVTVKDSTQTTQTADWWNKLSVIEADSLSVVLTADSITASDNSKYYKPTLVLRTGKPRVIRSEQAEQTTSDSIKVNSQTVTAEQTDTAIEQTQQTTAVAQPISCKRGLRAGG